VGIGGFKFDYDAVDADFADALEWYENVTTLFQKMKCAVAGDKWLSNVPVNVRVNVRVKDLKQDPPVEA
jgi:hypothetical protein